MRITTIIFLLISIQSFAQTEVKGKVIDAQNNQAIEYGSVALMNSDSVLITGGVTDSLGQFKISDFKKGTYFLQVSFIGYEKYNTTFFDIKLGQSKNFGTIKIQLSGENLEEFVVKEEQSMVQNNIDKKVFNVEKNITAQGGTAADVLENIPSVSFDIDGNIVFRGSPGVRVHIDGRPSGILGSDPNAVLEQIPASQVEAVEIITNPSAKYDPDGVSGIINIVLKKNKKFGVNGNVNLSWGIYDRLNAGAGLSVRNKKFNFFVNYSANLYNGFRNFNQTRTQFLSDTSNTLDQERKGTHYWLNQNVTIGSDFYLSEQDVLGVSLNGYYNMEKRTGDMFYYQMDSEFDTTQVWNRESDDPEVKKGFSADLTYEHKFKKNPKHKITTSLSGSYNVGVSEGFYKNFNFNNGIKEDEAYWQQNTVSDNTSSVYIGQFDYILPIKKSMQFETGLKAIIEGQRQDFYAESLTDSTSSFQNDVNISNDFQFSQDVYSWYATWGHSIKKFSYKVGVRLEQAIMTSELFTSNEKFTKNYFSFFPSAHIAQKIGERSELKLSYSRRIKRPSLWDVNPFPRYSDPYNLRVGNPNLNPEYINSTEFSYGFYAKKLTLTAALYFRQTKDLIQRVRLVTPEGVSITKFANIDDKYAYGLELVTMYKPFKWWSLNLSGNAFQSFIVDDDPVNDFNNSGFNYRFNFISSMTFWEDFQIQVSGYYRGPTIIPQGYLEPFFNLDAGIQKGILKGRGMVGIKITDIFNTKTFNLVFEDNNFIQKATWKQETRFFYINFTYRFGKSDSNKSKSKGGGTIN